MGGSIALDTGTKIGAAFVFTVVLREEDKGSDGVPGTELPSPVRLAGSCVY